MNDQRQLGFDRGVTLDEQIAELLTGRTAPMVDPKLKSLVMELQHRRGAARAIKNADLCQILGRSERDIKQMVKDLVEVHGLPVGASRVAPYGYYLAVTPEEINDTCRNYMREAISLFHRIKAIAGEQRMAEMHGQLLLEVAKPADPKEAA